jgi:general secretion pathway protein D
MPSLFNSPRPAARRRAWSVGRTLLAVLATTGAAFAQNATSAPAGNLTVPGQYHVLRPTVPGPSAAPVSSAAATGALTPVTAIPAPTVPRPSAPIGPISPTNRPDLGVPIPLENPPPGPAPAVSEIRRNTAPPVADLNNPPVNEETSATAPGTNPSPSVYASSNALMDGVPNPDRAVQVNFPDITAQEILRWIEAHTGKFIIQMQTLPATRLSFSTGLDANGRPRDVPLAEVVFALESLLSINGVVILPMSGPFFRAVPSEMTNPMAPPMLTDEELLGPASENIYSRFYHLDYISAADVAQMLQPLMTPRVSSLISFERSNSIMLTDTLTNLQRFDMLIKHADVKPEVQEDFIFIPLENAKSSDLAARLQRLQQTGLLRKYISATATIDSDDRTNQLFIIAPKGSRDLITDMVKKMDIDVDPKTHSEVFYIKQATATTLAQLLQQVVSGQLQSTQNPARAPVRTGAPGAPGFQPGALPGQAGGLPTPLTAGNAPAAAANPGVQQALTEAATRDQQFSPYITIVPDDRSNSIIVYGTSSDIRQIGDLIDKIDVLLAQVRIEVVITEVTLTKGQVDGLSSFGIGYHYESGNTTTGAAGGPGGSHDVNITTATNAAPNQSAPAFTFSGSLTNFGLDAVFNVAATNDKVKVLSAPSITATHNTTASVNVGEEYPIVTSTTTQIQNAATVGNNVTSTVSYAQIGITLQVTPLIGDNGYIQMNITQTDDTILNFVSINGIEQPVIGHRNATSYVSVKDGEVIVLGGLQQTNHNIEHDKVFLLGDLPLIGQAFRPTTEQDITSELIIFIKPTIVQSAKEARVIAEENVRNSLASKTVSQYLATGQVVPAPDNGANKAQIFDQAVKYIHNELSPANEETEETTVPQSDIDASTTAGNQSLPTPPQQTPTAPVSISRPQ